MTDFETLQSLKSAPSGWHFQGISLSRTDVNRFFDKPTGRWWNKSFRNYPSKWWWGKSSN